MPDKPDLHQMIETYQQQLDLLRTMLDAGERQEPRNPLLARFVPEAAPEPVMPPQIEVVPAPSEPVAMTMPPIEKWQEVLFKPSMASAMLYVLLPVIESIVNWDGVVNVEFQEWLKQIRTWSKLTIAQREALTELFRWVDAQLAAPDSVIPEHILANIAAAGQ